MAGGRPKGSPNKVDNKPFKQALEMQLAAKGTDLKALRKIADTVIKSAERGEQWAVDQIANRLDGRPHQSMQMEHSGKVITKIEREFVYPKNTDSAKV